MFESAVRLLQAGQLAEAEAVLRNVIAANAHDFDALHMLGVVGSQLGKTDEAEQCFQRAAAIDGNHPPLYQNWGLLLSRQRRFEEAVEKFSTAIRLAPQFPPVYSDRGNALGKLDRLDDALRDHDQAIRLAPNFFGFYNNRGNALREKKEYARALADYDRALQLNPNYADAFNGRGNVLCALKRTDEALSAYDRALALKPGFAEAWVGRGNVFYDLKRTDEAQAAYDQALALRPDLEDAWLGRGNVFCDLKRHDEALAAYDKALALRPGFADAWIGRGNVLFARNRDADAVTCFDTAIGLKPDSAEAHWNKALAKLSLGDFAEGWRLYEWRWQVRAFSGATRNFAQPQWRNDFDIRGKTLLVHCEQGLGDTIQFCRYLARLRATGAHVVFEVQAPLATLLRAQDWGCTVVAQGETLPPFDVHCPLLSLPLAFGASVDNVSEGVPYIAAPAGAPFDGLRPQPKPERLTIGVAWSGNPLFARGSDDRRPVPLRLLRSVMTEGFDWYRLQKDLRDSDAAALRDMPFLIDRSERFSSFAETAAVIAGLDLIVSIDTSVAHLAGAMGKPVWVLLPFHPDFRWLRARADCPWYPTARLYRQTRDGDWSDVLERVARDLKSL